MKPGHQGGFNVDHTELCERTLVTLLRGSGPWKRGIYLAGGLVPRYLIPRVAGYDQVPPHAGTTDVDVVLDLDLLAEIEAYRKLEQNLKDLGLKRGENDDGNAQHFSWRKPTRDGVTIVVDLLCEVPKYQGGRVVEIVGELRLSALNIPGAHLVTLDYVEVSITADLLDDGGVSTEVVRVANIAPFIVLKALAYDDRKEAKDAYDLIYCLEHYRSGPADVAAEIAKQIEKWPNEPLLLRAVSILRDRFATDDQTDGSRKDGPTSYAKFLTDPGRQHMDSQNRQRAAAVVELFLKRLEVLGVSTST